MAGNARPFAGVSSVRYHQDDFSRIILGLAAFISVAMFELMPEIRDRNRARPNSRIHPPSTHAGCSPSAGYSPSNATLSIAPV